MKSSRHKVEIHSYYIVLSYELKPIFAVAKSCNMDHVDVNLIRQLVSVEKYTYAQVIDYLKTKYSNSRGFSERKVRRYCKENERSSGTDTNEVNRMVADAVSQIKVPLSVINFLCLSAFAWYFISVAVCFLDNF